MNKEIDYQKVYSKHYKNLPNYLFWTIAIVVTHGALIAGIITVCYFDEVLGLIILFGGSAFAWISAFVTRVILVLSLSQKIVVADALLSLQHGNSGKDVDTDELPEL